ncbi:MAG: LpxD N-terminal domain-containing protein, partial [Pseudomonadota bacterium]
MTSQQVSTSGLALGDLASRFGCDVVGDPDVRVHSVATLSNAGDGQLTFLANPKYRQYLADTGASAVIVAAEAVDDCRTNAIVADDPYVVYARVASLLHPPVPVDSGVHAAAYCAPDAEVAASAHVAPGAVIESGARVGERVRIGPNCVVGRHSVIGD